jgi:hypothetical protein
MDSAQNAAFFKRQMCCNPRTSKFKPIPVTVEKVNTDTLNISKQFHCAFFSQCIIWFPFVFTQGINWFVLGLIRSQTDNNKSYNIIVLYVRYCLVNKGFRRKTIF